MGTLPLPWLQLSFYDRRSTCWSWPVLDAGMPVLNAAPLLAPGSCLFVGALHGSVEIPAVVCDLISSTVERGVPVLLGLEMDVTERTALATYLASDGSPAARQALLRHHHWARDDGCASEAVFSLIEHCRQIERRSRFASAACFGVDEDVPGVRGCTMHERAMGRAAQREIERLRHSDAERLGRAVVICLVGSGHCRGAPRACSEPTLGSIMREAWAPAVAGGATFASLVVHHAGGRIHGYAAGRHGVHEMRADGLRLPDGPSIELYGGGAEPTDGSATASADIEHGFDGALQLGCRLTPSPPARRAVDAAADPMRATSRASRCRRCSVQ